MKTLDYPLGKPPTYKSYEIRHNKKFPNVKMITEDEFNFLSKNNCYYCGKPGPNGIDRVDNSKGYVTGNCVPCCKHCNYVKGALSVTDFKTWTERFVNHQNKHKTIQLLMNIIYKLIK